MATKVGAPSASWLCTARCTIILPTVPLARWHPPPSGFTPTGPGHSGKGPSTFFHQGSRSMFS